MYFHYPYHFSYATFISFVRKSWLNLQQNLLAYPSNRVYLKIQEWFLIAMMTASHTMVGYFSVTLVWLDWIWIICNFWTPICMYVHKLHAAKWFLICDTLDFNDFNFFYLRYRLNSTLVVFNKQIIYWMLVHWSSFPRIELLASIGSDSFYLIFKKDSDLYPDK